MAPARVRRRVGAGAVVAIVLLGPAAQGAGAADAGDKIRLDLSALDAAGLYGPASGSRAMSYEFCIPDRAQAIAAVRGIDASVRMQRAPGRIGCAAGQLLCIGSTHRSGYREVLAALARLSYVERIEQAHFE